LLAADKAEETAALDTAFGSWADSGIDSLEYQLAIRAEWDHRPNVVLPGPLPTADT
jgi:hypothetical protein